MPPLVLKIGGSLLASGRAGAVLVRVARSPRQVVIVPGGGAYADAVRLGQADEGFSDARAHRLAILAMHRMAADFQGLEPALVRVETLDDIARTWAARGKPVWLPWAMVQHDASIPQDWSMTSDGLAAWLAGKLGGAEVALVKSCRVSPDASLADLADADIADPQFRAFVEKGDLKWHVLGAGDDARLCAILGSGEERRAQ